MKYFSISKDDVYKEFNSSYNGLNNKCLLNNIKEYGFNILPKKRKKSIIELFLEQFINPIEIVLIVCAFLSLFTGEYFDAFTLIFIILVDVIIGTIEEYKALSDSEKLISLIKTNCKVIRGGREVVIDSNCITVGDVLLLSSGDKVVGDCRILECNNFTVDESSLTGESIAVTKSDKELKEDTILAERCNMVFAGTSVITGRARVIVCSIGKDSEIGKITTTVDSIKDVKSPLTLKIEKFSTEVTIAIAIICIITIFILRIKAGYTVAAVFICVIALAVSAMPEGLPLAMTMALTIASKRMLKKNVIVKKLNAVEALGSCTVIATDKTGTLTLNEQTAKEIILFDGSNYEVSGIGYNGDGEITLKSDKANDKVLKDIIRLGVINNEASLDLVKNKWIYSGDSIDVAFLALGKKCDCGDLPKVESIVPYESENQYSAVFYKDNGKLHCCVKGSFEKVYSMCRKKDDLEKYNMLLCGNGYRVIAIADGIVDDTDINNIGKLKFLGVVGFIDPFREDAKKSILECKRAGIKVVMVTGDNPLTAYNIGKELGLCNDYDDVVTGKDLEKFKDNLDDYDKYISNKTIFSRVSPLDKYNIVESFKRMGEYVAVTGDGVNDSIAIQSAHIGVAMGSGTDVAKETADMIIVDDRFTSIVDGVKEGRVAFNNIKKIIFFLLSCGLAEVLFFILSILFGYDIPLVAIQLLWLNVVTDGLQDISLSFEKDKDIFKTKYDVNGNIFSKDLVFRIIISGITITLVVFGLWKYLIDKGVDITYARSIILMLMVFIQNIHVLDCKSDSKFIVNCNLFDNKLLLFTIVGSIVLQLIIAEIPFTANFLDVVPISIKDILLVFGLSLIIIFVNELYKLVIKIIKQFI